MDGQHPAPLSKWLRHVYPTIHRGFSCFILPNWCEVDFVHPGYRKPPLWVWFTAKGNSSFGVGCDVAVNMGLSKKAFLAAPSTARGGTSFQQGAISFTNPHVQYLWTIWVGQRVIHSTSHTHANKTPHNLPMSFFGSLVM